MPREFEAERAIQSFSEQIGQARRRLGFSQRQLGAQIRTPKRPDGVWNTYVGQIEKGDKVPSDEVVLKLAEVLRLDGGEVLLAAYRARTESTRVRTLLAQVEGALHQQSAREDGKGAHLAAESAAFSADEEWVGRLVAILATRGTSEVSRLLSSVVGLNERQWRAVSQALEAIRPGRLDS